MRIALLSWESLHSIAVGGVASHVSELAAALVRSGHNVHVFTRREHGQSGHDWIDGVHYHRCLYQGHHDFVDDVNNMCRSFVDRVFEVEDFIGNFDVIHAHDWLCANAMIWIKQGRGHKCVLTIHATEYARCGNSFSSGRASRIRDQERAGVYWADRVIAVSQATKNELMWMYEVPEWKVSVVYNGVSPSRFEFFTDPGEDKRRLDIAPLDPTVLFCGRMAWQKGPDLLMEAVPAILSCHGNAKFVFAGDGDMRAGLQNRARQLKVDHAVRFTGYRNSQEIVRLFKMADVICVPSRNEPFGIVVLEAWSASKPVVVTQSGGPSEYVRHEVDGLKIEPNPSSVAWGVCRLFSDFEKARWMGQNGRKVAEERFRWDMIVRQIIAVYRQVCPALQGEQSICESPSGRAEIAAAALENAGQDQATNLSARLRLRAKMAAGCNGRTLAFYRQGLMQMGLEPKSYNGSLLLDGDIETLLAALKHCHRQIHSSGVEKVACTLELETSLLSADKRYGQENEPSTNPKSGSGDKI
jgi:glycosyltransferase involved in cell wall biosynthesis